MQWPFLNKVPRLGMMNTLSIDLLIVSMTLDFPLNSILNIGISFIKADDKYMMPEKILK